MLATKNDKQVCASSKKYLLIELYEYFSTVFPFECLFESLKSNICTWEFE